VTDPVLLRLAFAVLTAVGAWPLLRPLPSLLRRLGFLKINFAGRGICTAGGLPWLLMAVPWLWLSPDPRDLLAGLAVLGFGALGLIDDRWGTAEFKGLRGHLGALRRGRVTTGLLKAAGGGLLALGLGWRMHGLAGALVSAPLIALAANLLNLLDLRPLRALKAFWLGAAALLLAAPLFLAVALGLSLPYHRLEARRVVMLGDTGANALGALLGVAAAGALPLPTQAVLVGALLLFHAWAERHSLTAWIDAHPWARALDRWGWAEAREREVTTDGHG
jgi:UDP-GlcNAc:undecaprenyl-phosphate GlcNAc-1-phosphate transferase